MGFLVCCQHLVRYVERSTSPGRRQRPDLKERRGRRLRVHVVVMRVQFRLNWIREGKIEDAFWKFVDMPALPPVGCNVYLDNKGDGELGIVEVKEIWWSESKPSYFEVDLESIDTGDEDRQVTIDWMRTLGWTHESEKPSCEASA